MALDSISPVSNEKNHNFFCSKFSWECLLILRYLCKKSKEVPTAECPDTSFGDMLFQTCGKQIEIKSQPQWRAM